MALIDELLKTNEGTGPSFTTQREIIESVQQRISVCPYSFCFTRVCWSFADGTLSLKGSASSFYLKQVLQVMLRDLKYIDRIVNEVRVISSTGLSSEQSDG